MSLNTTMLGSAAFNQLLSSFSPAQINAMAQSVSHLAPVPVGEMKRSMKGHSKKKEPFTLAPTKATRPLNSWIAFRSYYSVIFGSAQQKEISGFLTLLWQSDPFKAKWSILAKAYSVIRDSKGKHNTPLDSFLAINGPLVGIVSPSKYLTLLGWGLGFDHENKLGLYRDEEVTASSLAQELLTTNVSVEDVIKHSFNCGYADGAGLAIPGNEVSMAMASSLRSTTVTQAEVTSQASLNTTKAQDVTMTEQDEDERLFEQNLINVVQAQFGTNAGDTGETDDVTNGNQASQLLSAPVPDDTESVGKTDELSAHVSSTLIKSGESASDTVSSSNENATLGLNAVIDHASLMNNTNFSLDDDADYPFNKCFDPNLPGLMFDPFEGDPFNAFDLSDYVHEDAFE